MFIIFFIKTPSKDYRNEEIILRFYLFSYMYINLLILLKTMIKLIKGYSEERDIFV